jgi:hypothetical protein
VVDELVQAISMPGVFIMFALAGLVLYEVGYVLGRWYQRRTPEEKEGPTGMIVGSILALMAFLLAITMGMATDRYDTRRGLVMAEANAVGTAHLRTGYLPEPVAAESRRLLGEYITLRIAPENLEGARETVAQSREVLAELWAITEELAREDPTSPLLAIYVEAVNEVIDVENERSYAGVNVRVPETVMLLLFVGSVLTLGMVGLSAGLTGRRSLLTALAMIVVLGAVVTLIVDIDRPQTGSVTISQQPIIELAEQIGPAPPPE